MPFSEQTLALNSGENGAAVLATDAQYVYYGLSTSPTKILRVRRDTFVRDATTLTLPTGNDFIGGAAIDAANGFLYVGTDGNPATVVKIRLSDFTVANTFSFNAGEFSAYALQFDAANDLLYVGLSVFPAKIVKFKASTLARLATLTLNAGEGGVNNSGAMPIDLAGGFLYVGTASTPAPIVKVRLSDFTRVGAISGLLSGDGFIVSGAADLTNGYLYFGTDRGSSPGEVVKVRLSDFTLAASLTLTSPEIHPDSINLDAAHGCLHVGCLETPGQVARIDLATFAQTGVVTLGSTDASAVGLLTSNGEYYIGTTESPARLIKLLLPVPTPFRRPLNNVLSTLASPYVAGSGTLAVKPGEGVNFGTPTLAAPIRATVVVSTTYGTAAETLTIFQATGRTGDTLTGVSAIEGTTDRAYAAGDKIEMRDTAGAFGDIHSAVNALETLETTTVYSDGSYANPAWITSLSASKITGILPIADGGTGQATAAAALTALLPSQGGQAGKSLTTDGTAATWTAAGSGTVTSVGLALPATFTVSGSPVTASGTLTAVYATQTANTIFAGPTTGAAAAPTFRALVAADLPAIAESQVTNLVSDLAAKAADSAVVHNTGNETIAGVKTFSSTITGSISGNAGTATNGVVTTGSYSDPIWISSLAGSKISGNILGNAANVTGTVAIANGGTGQVTASAAFNALSPLTTLGDILYASAVNTASRLAGNTTSAKQFLSQTGTGTVSAAPAWATLAKTDLPATTAYTDVANTFTAIPQSITLAAGGTFIALDGLANACYITAHGGGSPGGFTFQGGSDGSVGAHFGLRSGGGVAMASAGDLIPITISSSGVTAAADATVPFGRSNLRWSNVFTGILNVLIAAIGNVGLTIRAASGQTADLAQLVKSDGTSIFFGFDKLARPYTGNTTPTTTAGTGAGTSPTVSVAGTDVNGVITVLTGTTPAASATVVTLNFSTALAAAPKTVILTAANVNAAGRSGVSDVYVDSAGLTTAKFDITSGTTNLVASTSYKWYYQVLG